MKKIWNLCIVFVLIVSAGSSLVLAEEDDVTTGEEPSEGGCVWAFDQSNTQNECEQYCGLWVFENASLSYTTFEECEKCRFDFIDNQTDENETEEPEGNETEQPDENETEEPDPQQNNTEVPRIDIVFVIDSTGSMSDEIREVKMHIKKLISEILEGNPKPDVEIGFVSYRDYSDEEPEYLFKKYFLTNDIDEVMKNLEEIVAMYGGDYEEAVTVGLDVALNEMNWRVAEGSISGYDEYQRPIKASNSSIKRMMFLIGDAPPRTKEFIDSEGSIIIPPGYKDKIEDAKRKDITIYTISGSGMDSQGIEIWKEIARETGGEYEELTYERKNVTVYVTEEKLDEEWVEKAKGESDYDSADGTILTNSLGAFVCSAVYREAEDMGVRFTDEKISSRHYIGSIGYFIDNESDGTYDLFYSNATSNNTSFKKQENETYLIDDNGDGTWDYSYNTMSATIIPLNENKDTNGSRETSWLPLLGVFIAILLVFSFVFLYKKKRK